MRTIVIGAGAIGLSCAYYMRKSGVEVTVVDSAPPGSKASSHNAGWVVPSMPIPVAGVPPQQLHRMLHRHDLPPTSSPQALRPLATASRNRTTARLEAGLKVLAELSAETLQLFDDMAADGVQFESHADPITLLSKDAPKLERHAAELEAMASVIPGFSWRPMDRSDLRREMPYVAGGLAGGLQIFGNRSLDPASFTTGLAAACTREGVEFRLGRPASLQQETDTSVAVLLGREVLRADRIVIAAGVWTNQVLAGVHEGLALQAGKGHGFDLPREAGDPTHPLYLAEAGVTITPLETTVRLAGTVGSGGNDETVSTARVGGLLTHLSTYFPRWPNRTKRSRTWTGLQPMTPDGLPIIGPLPRHPHVLVATGHTMLAGSLAPPTGRLIAEMATGQLAARHRASLSADRF